jgi:hypothetical protein
MLKKTEIPRLFEKFSSPLTTPCISASQMESAVGIAKILWLALVTASDSQQEIQAILQQIVPNKPDAEQSLGALYFYTMRTALTRKERRKLQAYYRVSEHFHTLRDWMHTDALNAEKIPE